MRINVTRSSMPPMEEYVEEIRSLWDSHWLTNNGEKLKKLEAALKERLDVPCAALFTNGHLALEALLKALGLKGEVITTPFTFASTTHAIVRAGLTPVFHQSEEAIFLLADGRLLWRAMSNVLSNAVKYALPGTRLYVDVSAAGDKAIISFKNISGAQLNISAEELMERFVRGDSSRNTEGSGLGLNIAKSLMELQKGQLQLLVDGDLFKVTLVFPRAD